MQAMKPRVKCSRVSFVKWPNTPHYVAYLDRLSDHPRLGEPRTESQMRTSALLRVDFVKKEVETMNTIYWWED
jgi:hypothetical protein